MADPTQTNISVQDIPSYMQPYRKGLLNAAFGLVFKPGTDWFKQTFPGAIMTDDPGYTPPPSTGNPGGGGGNPDTPPVFTNAFSTPSSGGSGGSPTPGVDAAANLYGGSGMPSSSGLNSLSGPINGMGASVPGVSIPGYQYDPNLGYYVPKAQASSGHSNGMGQLASFSGGGSVGQTQLDKAYEALANSINPGVSIGEGGSPIGGLYPGFTTGGTIIPSHIPTNTTGAPIAGNPTPYTPGTPGVNPGGGPLQFQYLGGLDPVKYNGGPGYGVTIPPPMGSPGSPGNPGGGGNPGAPGGGGLPPPPAGMNVPHSNIFGSVGGAGTGPQGATDSGYNPGQYASDATAQGLATRLGGVLNHTTTDGPNAPPPQNLIDMGGAAQLNAGLVNQFLNHGPNGSANNASQNSLALAQLRAQVSNDGGDTSKLDKMIADNTAAYNAQQNQPSNPVISQAPSINGRHAAGGLASYEIGSDGKVRNYRRGGTIRKLAGQTVDPSSDPNTTSGAPNVFGAGSAAPETAGSSGIFQPYTPYTQQRTLAFSPSFGQTGQNGVLQASTLTQNALGGYGNLPSYYNSEGYINPNSNFGQGAENVANATNMAGIVAGMGTAKAIDSLNNPNLTSTFQQTWQNLLNNPQSFQAGDVNIPQLQAPQLEQPGSVQGTDYGQIAKNLGNLTAYQSGYSPTLNNYQMTAPSNVQNQNTRTQGFNNTSAQQLMSPYMQQVVDTQNKQLDLQSQEDKARRDASAVAAGAFGGSRQGVAESLAQRDLMNAKNQNQAAGSQAAFANAQNQFNTQQALGLQSQQGNQSANLQSQLANQNAGMNVGANNLNALLQTQGLGAGIGQNTALANLSAANQAGLAQYGSQSSAAQLAAQQALAAQLANQQAGLTAGQANMNSALQTQQLGTQAGLQAQLANQSTRMQQNNTLLNAGMSADQLQQQAYQGNFGNQLAALGTANQLQQGYNQTSQGYTDLSRLANQLQLQNLQAQQQAGGEIDAQTQSALNLGYQDYINQQNYPYQQLNFLQGMVSGTPMGTALNTVQFQRPSAGGLTGLATAGLGGLMNMGGSSGGGG